MATKTMATNWKGLASFLGVPEHKVKSLRLIPMENDNNISKIADEVTEELERAESKFAPFNSAHEGYAVLLEEVDELWDVVKLNPKKIQYSLSHPDSQPPNKRAWQQKQHHKMMRAEAIQVAAMAMRFVKGIDNNWDK